MMGQEDNFPRLKQGAKLGIKLETIPLKKAQIYNNFMKIKENMCRNIYLTRKPLADAVNSGTQSIFDSIKPSNGQFLGTWKMRMDIKLLPYSPWKDRRGARRTSISNDHAICQITPCS